MTEKDDLKEINGTDNTVDTNLQMTENKSIENDINLPVEEVISDDIVPQKEKPVRKTKSKSNSDKSTLVNEAPEKELIEGLPASTDDITNDIDDDIEEETVDYDAFSRIELVDAIEKAVTGKSIEKIKRRIVLIKLAYIKLTKEEKEKKLNDFLKIEGSKKEDYKPESDILEARFNTAFSIYKEKKKKYDEAVENEKNINLDKKKLILDEIKKLIDSGDELKHTYDSFKKLQYAWKETGQVPHTETNNLWQSYHFLVEKFLDKVRINEELRDLDRKKNLEQCIELCEKAEELMLNPSINESYKLLQQYHDEWKEIGSLPQDKKEEVWERFRQASIKVNERRREHFEKIRIEQEHNLTAKTALCEKVEEVVKRNFNNSKSFQEATDEIIEIQNLWKSIGAVAIEHKDQIWKRFRSAINLFFDNKKEHFEGIKEEYLNNYNLKLDLCNQAEAIKVSHDWKNATYDLIKLQNEWKQIGPLPKKQSDTLWKKFRAACDYFFEKKKDYFSNIDGKEKENLQAKLDLIEKVKTDKIEGDNKKVFDVIKEYQREFTAIGHVPMAEKEKIQNLFRDVINAKLDELKINPVEKKIMGYKSKFEPLKNDPRNNDVIKNEIRFVSNKIAQVNTDIQLWENNIGFFANSKSANVLKKEFENKIEKAKEEIIVLEEKLKFLKER